MSNTILLPFQPDSMTRAQLAAVSYLARHSGHTHSLYAYQLRRWFEWCETNRLDPLDGIQRAHVELYIRHLGGCGLMPSSINTTMHAVRGFFRFAHIDGLIPSDPAVYARLPKIHTDESRTQGLDRLEQPGPPLHDEATAERLRELISKGALGGLVFITDDARAMYNTLRERGVTDFTQEPTERFYGVDMGVRDPFGNAIRILQQGR